MSGNCERAMDVDVLSCNGSRSREGMGNASLGGDDGREQMFPPSKYVRQFVYSMQKYRDSADDCLEGLSSGRFNRRAFDARDDAWNNADKLFANQVGKVVDEFNEMLTEVDLERVEESDLAALSLMGKSATLVKATLQLMYMVGSLHGISTNEVLGMTKLKCLRRDSGFYNLPGNYDY